MFLMRAATGPAARRRVRWTPRAPQNERRVTAAYGEQALPSGRHIPEAHGLLMLALQFPLPSQVGVTRVSAGQDATPQTVPAG